MSKKKKFEKRFVPITEEEAADVLQPGEYDFEVLEADETVREKTGALMFKVKLNVFGNDRNRHVYNYIGTDFMKHVLRHFCYSTGVDALYESGTLKADDMVGRAGKVKLRVETDDYGTKNAVVDYVVAKNKPKPSDYAEPASPVKEAAKAMGLDDDIPF